LAEGTGNGSFARLPSRHPSQQTSPIKVIAVRGSHRSVSPCSPNRSHVEAMWW
jgi:hypothetical protein